MDEHDQQDREEHVHNYIPEKGVKANNGKFTKWLADCVDELYKQGELTQEVLIDRIQDYFKISIE